jgi:hypothetical protein
MQANLREIPLGAIDASFDTFSTSWPGESQRLAGSVARAGVIQPPLLVERDGRLVAACGLRRVRAAAQAGLPALQALVSAGNVPADDELLELNAEDNLSERDFNLLEKARFVTLACKLEHGARGRLMHRFGPAIGVAAGSRDIENLRALYALPGPVKEFIHFRKLPARTAFHLAAMGGDDAGILVSTAKGCALTVSQTGELAELAREIMQRDNVECGELCSLLHAGEETAREDLMERLRTLRFPRWRDREAAMKKCLDSVNGVKGVTVRHPPFFEGRDLRAEIVFRTPRELAERVRALGRFAEGPASAEACRLL